MTSLPDFLLARIQDEQSDAEAAIKALKAANESAEWWVDGPGEKSGKWWIYATGEKFEHKAVAQHIARHDPARVLADCAARRAIVELVIAWTHEVVEDCWYTCAAATEDRDGGETCDDARRGTGCDCGLDSRVKAILLHMAQPYADHEGFESGWVL